MRDMVIRYARREDVKRLVELCRLHAEHEESPFDVQGKEQKLAEHLFGKYPVLRCLLVVIDQKIIGYASYLKQFSTWDADYYLYMDCLFMTTEKRGFGIGQKLMNRIKEEGRKMDCSHIQWQTPDFNKKAMKFYEKIGANSKSKERYYLEILQEKRSIKGHGIKVSRSDKQD